METAQTCTGPCGLALPRKSFNGRTHCRRCETKRVADCKKEKADNGICIECLTAPALDGLKRCDACLVRINNRRIRNVYGISAEQYAELFKAQDERCAICRCPGTTRRYRHRPLSIDHCRKSGAIRGL